MSSSNLSKIHQLNFVEYATKKPRNFFAHCSTYDKLHSLWKAIVVGFQATMLWTYRLELHLDNAWMHQKLFYANLYHSRFFPGECIIIMQDKTDYAKIASSMFSHRTKQLGGLMKLLASVTKMLAHGHGDVCYAHYGLDLFAHDSNYTVGSFAKLLRDLEMLLKSSSRQLFNGSRLTPLFQACCMEHKCMRYHCCCWLKHQFYLHRCFPF
jgi:hypothetical protein